MPTVTERPFRVRAKRSITDESGDTWIVVPEGMTGTCTGASSAAPAARPGGGYPESLIRLTVFWDSIAMFLPKEDADSCTVTYGGWEDLFVKPEDIEFIGWPWQRSGRHPSRWR